MQNPKLDAAEADDWSLDDLVNESMQAAEDTRRLKDSRKALKENRNLPGTTLEELIADVKRIELAREWSPAAHVAMFSVQTCAYCGNVQAAFSGIFMKQVHRSSRSLFRWVAAKTSEVINLPREVKYTEVELGMCHFCMAEQGFDASALGIEYDDNTTEAVATDDGEPEFGVEHEPTAEVAEPSDDSQFPLFPTPPTTHFEERFHAVQ